MDAVTWGDMIAARLSDSNAFMGSPRSDAPSSMAVVTVTDGIPSYVFKRDGTADRMITTGSIEAAMGPACRVFHIGSMAQKYE